MRPKVSAVLLAAGSSTRYGTDKLEESLFGKPVWWVATEAFLTCPGVDEVVVVGRDTASLGSRFPGLQCCEGGSSRQESARRGLAVTSGELVLVHDAARPFVSSELISAVIASAQQRGAAFPGLASTDTLRQARGDGWETLPREQVFQVQTPQGFKRALLERAYALDLPLVTDDTGLVEALGEPVVAVVGDRRNIKVTHRGDLNVALEYRTGLGYDVHAFSDDPDRPLWLGGVEFPDDRPGLEGHSDADALVHAVVDALLGAASLGDIGLHYPNTDPMWKNCPSLRFLAETRVLLRRSNWHIVNIDTSVLAERPRVMRRNDEIRAAIANAAGVEVDRVSVKATTNEKLGAIGRGEGIAAFATATLTRATG